MPLYLIHHQVMAMLLPLSSVPAPFPQALFFMHEDYLQPPTHMSCFHYLKSAVFHHRPWQSPNSLNLHPSLLLCLPLPSSKACVPAVGLQVDGVTCYGKSLSLNTRLYLSQDCAFPLFNKSIHIYLSDLSFLHPWRACSGSSSQQTPFLWHL